MMETKEKKCIKTNIEVGSAMKAKVGDPEDKKMEGRTRRTMKEVVGCVQDVVGNNKFVVQFEYGQKKEMIYSSISFVCEKDEVGEVLESFI